MNCLVLMPMLAGFEDIRASVARAVEAAGLQMLRLEVEIEDSAWHAWVLDALDQADVALADLTAHNAYVMYELGCAHQRKLPVSYIVDERDGRITSSVRGCSFNPYGRDQRGFVGEVADELKQLLAAAGDWQPGSEMAAMLHEADELTEAFARTEGRTFALVHPEVFASRVAVAARRGHPDPRSMAASVRARHLLAWRLAESERVEVMKSLGHWCASLR